MRATKSEHIRPIDQAVLDLLRQHEGLSIHDFTGNLQVTATAIRQRLDRLVKMELVERRKMNVGRGRPQFRYFLTPLALRFSAATYADLASALWAEVMEMPNSNLRRGLIRRVAHRMSDGFTDQFADDATVEQRLELVADEMTKRKVPACVTSNQSMPVLNVLACPFPELAVEAHDRHVCEMEQEMIGAAIGHAVKLECCRLDGHSCCQFRLNEDY